MSGVTGSTPEHPERGIVERIDAVLADNDAGPGWDETDLTWCAEFLDEQFGIIERPISGYNSETKQVSMMVRWVRWARLVMRAWLRDRALLADARSEITTRDAEIERLSAEVAALLERLEVRGDIDMAHTVRYLRNGVPGSSPASNIVLHHMHAKTIASQLEQTFLSADAPNWDPSGEPDGPGSPDDRYGRHPLPVVSADAPVLADPPRDLLGDLERSLQRPVPAETTPEDER